MRIDKPNCLNTEYSVCYNNDDDKKGFLVHNRILTYNNVIKSLDDYKYNFLMEEEKKLSKKLLKRIGKFNNDNLKKLSYFIEELKNDK